MKFTTEPKILLPWLIAGWVILVFGAWVMSRRKNTPTTGGILLYLCLISLVHFFGAFVHALPWYYAQGAYLVQGGSDTVTVAHGFASSLLGLTGFLLGSILIHHKARVSNPLAIRKFDLTKFNYWHLIFAGAGIGIILKPLVSSVSSLTAVLSASSNLTLIGFLLAARKHWLDGERKLAAGWCFASILFPVTTTLTGGFIGYGVASVIILIVFMQRYLRRGWIVCVLAPPLIYLGLSVWVTYARDRQMIRDTVWGEQAWSARIQQFQETFTRFELFDWKNQQHLELIDGRMNQNVLVGQVMDNMAAGNASPAYGSTLAFAFVAWVPRAIWWNKPSVGGSGDIVAAYSGTSFADGTSVGIGQIIEFYINFENPGVFFGMMFLGIFIAYLDFRAANCLDRNDHWGFVVWFLPMLGAMQPGGALAEVVASSAGAAVLMGIGYLMFRRTLSSSASA